LWMFTWNVTTVNRIFNPQDVYVGNLDLYQHFFNWNDMRFQYTKG
jgi:hypothetical protein